MPYIEEKHLLELHKTIDKSNEERDEFETGFRNFRNKNKRLKNERNILMRLSVISLFFLIAIVAFYLITPNLFIQKRYLQANGLAIVKQEVSNLKKEVANIDYEVNDYIANQKQESNQGIEPVIENKTSNSMFYVVQVAASETQIASIFHRGLKGLKETQEDGYYKYFLGDFETLTEAQNYRKELLKIGFEDAFVVSYKNDKRLKIEEALQ